MSVCLSPFTPFYLYQSPHPPNVTPLSPSQGGTSPWLSLGSASRLPLRTPTPFPTVLTWPSSRGGTRWALALMLTRTPRGRCLQSEPSSCGPDKDGLSPVAARECPVARTLRSPSQTLRMTTSLTTSQVGLLKDVFNYKIIGLRKREGARLNKLTTNQGEDGLIENDCQFLKRS